MVSQARPSPARGACLPPSGLPPQSSKSPDDGLGASSSCPDEGSRDAARPSGRHGCESEDGNPQNPHLPLACHLTSLLVSRGDHPSLIHRCSYAGYRGVVAVRREGPLGCRVDSLLGWSSHWMGWTGVLHRPGCLRSSGETVDWPRDQ